eukprot:10838421-Lingulodinium_polyedra.AAC.1
MASDPSSIRGAHPLCILRQEQCINAVHVVIPSGGKAQEAYAEAAAQENVPVGTLSRWYRNRVR